MPVTMARVYAYSINEQGWISNIVIVDINGTNSYEFPAVPEGKIMIKVEPTPGAYPDYLPTYLGNTALYARADRFVLDKDTTVSPIYLVHKPSHNSGSIYLSGFIGFAIAYNPSAEPAVHLSLKKAREDITPIPDLWVFLLDSTGEVVFYDVSDSLGKFNIDSIPTGHYSFYTDYMGWPMDPANDSLLLDQGNHNYNITASTGEKGIFFSLSDVTDINKTVFNRGVIVYPNPVTDNLYLKFDKTAGEDVRIRIIGIDGNIVKTLELKSIQEKEVLNISVSDLSPGMYILSIEGSRINYKARVVKQ
jgi:hypothetical protein